MIYFGDSITNYNLNNNRINAYIISVNDNAFNKIDDIGTIPDCPFITSNTMNMVECLSLSHLTIYNYSN